TLTAGFGYQLWLQGVDAGQGTLGDPLLAVMNSEGVFITSNNDQSAGTRDSFIYFAATSSGTYYLDAQESGNDATGSYTLILESDALDSTSSAATMAMDGM